jgi:hypothetical protein
MRLNISFSLALQGVAIDMILQIRYLLDNGDTLLNYKIVMMSCRFVLMIKGDKWLGLFKHQ